MITSKTRAVVLLAAALVVGGVLGSLATRLRDDRGDDGGNWRRNLPGSSWLKDYRPDSTLMGRLDSAWVTNECIIDSVQRARIGAQSESLMLSFRPVLDSLRTLNRAGIRDILPEQLRSKYDSSNAADDSTRTRRWAQRNTRGGPCGEAWMRWNTRSGGPPGGGRGGRGPN